MKSGLTAMFTPSDIDAEMANFMNTATSKIISVLSYVGEKFVNMARNTQTYRDQTGNLRSSIGYVIAINGSIEQKKISGTSEGVDRANEIASEIVSATPEGIVLIGFAGMEYASAVESKGYDVISNSVESSDSILRKLKQGLGL